MKNNCSAVPARVNPVCIHPEEKRKSLSKGWRFKLDPDDKGVKEKWFKKPDIFSEKIKVPGCWQGQGFGNEDTDYIWDFRLNLRVFKKTYKGTGWYCLVFKVPDDWKEKIIHLNFGGVHPSADIWLNGNFIGSHSGPFIPFGYQITDNIKFGKDNVLVVRVHEKDRWMGLAYNWMGNWSGLYRDVEITATGKVWIKQIGLIPDVDNEILRLRIFPGNTGEIIKDVDVMVSIYPYGKKEKEIKLESSLDSIEKNGFCLDIPVKSPLLWSPDSPQLYRVDVVLKNKEDFFDALSERTGFVKLSTEGKKFLINGNPFYMIGTGEFAITPETGSPDSSRERWRKKLATLKDYGYNYVRCQSYVPTPEYYDVADELGILVQGEMGMLGAWGGSNQWHTYAWPKPTPEFYMKLKWQWDNTVKRDLNHPSANIYCMSNELYRTTDFPRIAWKCYKDTKKIKPTALVIWTDGGFNPELPSDFVNDQAEIDKQTPLPVIQHEFRWWSTYPDVRIKKKFKNQALRPYAIEVAEKAACKTGLYKLLPAFALNSQKLQYIEARTKLENCRRDNPQLAGICHFSGTDFQLSPQGILDDFYQKKLVDAKTWKQTMGQTVILIDKNFGDRVFTGREKAEFSIFVSDFSHPPLQEPSIIWSFLTKDNNVIEKGEFQFQNKPFCTHPAGKITINFPQVSKPVQIMLDVKLVDGKREFTNNWKFWLFPSDVKIPSSVAINGKPEYTWLKTWTEYFPLIQQDTSDMPKVLLTEILNEEIFEYIYKGGKVLLAASEEIVRPFSPKLGLTTGRYFFLPPANYAPFEDGNSGTIISKHPVLQDFPHEGFADFQFYNMIAEYPPIDLYIFNEKVEPIIRSISTYFIARPLCYLVEFSYGKGILIITSLNLDSKLPEARYLFVSILNYMLGDKCFSKNILSKKDKDFLLQIYSV